MKGITVKEFGDSDVCQLVNDLLVPEPQENQIKVHAAGVNPVDTYIRAGTAGRPPKMPYTPGIDSAGIITKLGSNVKNFKVGDRVFTINSVSGTYAEIAVSNATHTFKLPDNMSFEEGSALGVPYFTAYRGLFIKANAKQGETALIHGASGSVGIACIQLAKSQNLKVIGTAGTDAGMKQVLAQGADLVFNHREKGYMEKIKASCPGGVDIVIEMSGNVNLSNDLIALKKKGRLVLIGSKGTIEINPSIILVKEISIFGVFLFESTEDEFSKSFNNINEFIKANKIKPVLGRMYKLGDAAKAHHDIAHNEGSSGRLTLKID